MATPAEAQRALAAFRKGMPYAILRGLRKGLPMIVRLATTKYMERKDNRHPIKSYDPPNPEPGPLGIRQGNLARSVRVGDMRYTGKAIIGSIKAGDQNVRYARTHEYGMMIQARNGPYLVFPMGLPGGGYFVCKTPFVVVPARPYIAPAVQDAMPEVQARIVKEIRTLARATLRGVARFH